ncbi:MAG TPA: tripartite tricarboxylate transporter substrate binding protein [Casimicrobiaceae bacterium]|nr:tripartite tricarboxylate transporter substrate binding protein [Casimicrobiaceae bacterium]
MSSPRHDDARRPCDLGRRTLLCAAFAAPWLAFSARAAKDGKYPDRPIVLVLPSPIGGTSDLLARLLEAWLEEALGQPVIVEAKPGAAGRIAVDFVAGAAPDGYTLLVANNGANAILPAGNSQPVDKPKQFAPITMVARLPILVAASPAAGIDSLRALISRAGREPDELAYASGGIGSTSHTAAVRLFQRAGVRLIHVPYVGTAAAVKDVLADNVPILFTHLGTVASLVRAGRLRALAVTGSARTPEFSEIPTVAELGYPGFDVTTWHGVVAPIGTPREIIVRLHDMLVRAIARPEARAQLAQLGMEPVGSSPEEFARAIADDVRNWSEVLRSMRNAPQ